MVLILQNGAEFYSLINNSNYSATVVDYTASWCGPCRMIKPFIKELASKYTDIQFLEVDVDKFEDLAASAGVSAMPTFVIYQNGTATNDSVIGANGKELEKMVKKYSNTERPSDASQTTTEQQDNRGFFERYCTIL